MVQSGKHQRRLRNFLIDPKVQLKLTIVMVVITTLLTAGLGYFWYEEGRTTSRMLRVNALASLDKELSSKIDQELSRSDRNRLVALFGFAALLTLLSAGYGIFVTHKLAGPIFKMTKHMHDIEANRLYKLWGLRKGDQLKEFFGAFQSMHAALRERVERDMILLNQIIAAIERGEDPRSAGAHRSGDIKDLVPRIRAMVVEKGDSLRDASDVTQKIQRPT